MTTLSSSTRQWALLLIAFCVLLPICSDLLGEDDRALEEAWKRLPKAERHYARGVREYNERRYEDASAAFRKCVQELPRHAYAHYYLANLTYIRGDYQTALACMEEALESYPFMQELNDYAVRKKNRQLDSFQQMLEAEWENTNSCRTSRKIETLSGELTDEKIKLDSLVAEKQAASRLQKAHYLYFLGNIYFQLQRYAEAGQKYREAIDLNPRHASAYNNAAAVAYMAGKPLEALAFLDIAGDQGLEDNLNLTLQHLVFEALGRPTEGILQEDLSPGEEGDLGVMRFALAYKSDDALLPPLFENGYVVFSRTSGQSVIIDPGVEDPRIADFIAARRLEVRAVLNTHGHLDHTAANEHYARLYNVPVFVHVLDAKSLVSPPEKLLKDGESLSFEGFDVEVFHTPGHTPGSVCFSIGGFLFTGDTLFRNDVGGVGTENPEKAKAALDALVRVIKEKLLILPGATRVCPGHGKTSTVADEKADNPFLR